MILSHERRFEVLEEITETIRFLRSLRVPEEQIQTVLDQKLKRIIIRVDDELKEFNCCLN